MEKTVNKLVILVQEEKKEELLQLAKQFFSDIEMINISDEELISLTAPDGTDLVMGFDKGNILVMKKCLESSKDCKLTIAVTRN